jgi:hypothetical protein
MSLFRKLLGFFNKGANAPTLRLAQLKITGITCDPPHFYTGLVDLRRASSNIPSAKSSPVT